jgi:hypothetical protein
MTILRMSNACLLPKATDMNLDYGILLLSPATMAARTLLNGTLYLHCLSFLHLIVFLSDLSSCHVLSIIYTNFCFSQKKMILSPLVLDSNFLPHIQRLVLFRRNHVVESGKDCFKSFFDVSVEFYAPMFKVCTVKWD